MRGKTVLEGIRENRSNKEISESSGYVEKGVEEIRGWWLDYLKSKAPRRRHLDRLVQLAEKLRSCIINPNLPLQIYVGESVWLWQGHDWRIIPQEWFRAVTPYLIDENLWGEQLEYLKKHMVSSPFLQHYEKLEKDTSVVSHKWPYNEQVCRG